MDRVKTTTRRDEKHFSFGILWALYKRFDIKIYRAQYIFPYHAGENFLSILFYYEQFLNCCLGEFKIPTFSQQNPSTIYWYLVIFNNGFRSS